MLGLNREVAEFAVGCWFYAGKLCFRGKRGGDGGGHKVKMLLIDLISLSYTHRDSHGSRHVWWSGGAEKKGGRRKGTRGGFGWSEKRPRKFFGHLGFFLCDTLDSLVSNNLRRNTYLTPVSDKIQTPMIRSTYHHLKE